MEAVHLIVSIYVQSLLVDLISIDHLSPAIALTGNSSNLTCISNDYGYNNVFSRQITAYGEIHDTLIVYTTSGKSENIIELVKRLVESQTYNCYDWRIY